jgi:hypothetical protein
MGFSPLKAIKSDLMLGGDRSQTLSIRFIYVWFMFGEAK